MSITAFFYGTLMSPGVLYRVIYGDPHPRLIDHPSMKFLTFSSGLLHNHRRHKVIGADYPAILPKDGGSVRGTVVSGLTEGDMWRLDIFEGTQYERRLVNVQVLKDVELSEAAPTAETQREAHDTGKDAKKLSNDEEKTEFKGEKNETANPSNEGEYVWAQTYIWFSAPSELDPSEWDFEEFKREKMNDWMGLSSNGLAEKDEGFDDVDRAVSEARGRSDGKNSDGMGGRGVNGHIGRELAQAQKQLKDHRTKSP